MAPILRNLVAVALLWGAIYYLQKKKVFIPLFLCFLAMGFHKSAFIIIVLIIMSSVFAYIPNIINIFLLVLSILISPYIGKFLAVILSIIDNQYLEAHYSYASSYGSFFLLSLPHILSIFILLNKKRILFDSPLKKMLFNFAIMSVLLIPISVLIVGFYRIKMFFDLFWAIAVYMCIKNYYNRFTKYVFLMVYMISSSFLLTFDLINRNNYIPYTNYFLDRDTIPSNDKNYTSNNSPFTKLGLKKK